MSGCAREVLVEGCRIAVLQRGQGPALMALHGGPGLDHTTLLPGMQTLEQCYTVYYVDLRGHGLSDRPALETLTFRQLARDVEAVRQALELERFALLGHSMGAKVAVLYALEFPRALTALVLVGANLTPPRFVAAFLGAPGRLWTRLKLVWWALSGAVLEAIGRPLTQEENQRRFWSFAWRFYTRREQPSPRLREILLGSLKPPLSAFNPLMVELSTVDLSRVISAVTVPSLIVCGEEDILFWEDQHALFSLPRATFVSIPNAGHFPHIDEPEEFALVVRTFLNDHMGGQTPAQQWGGTRRSLPGGGLRVTSLGVRS